MYKINSLICALGVLFLLSSCCCDDEPKKKVLEFSYTQSYNVKTEYDTGIYPRIRISLDGEEGEAILKCVNSNRIVIKNGAKDSEEYTDEICQYTAKVTEPGVVKLQFNKMRDAKKGESLYSILVFGDARNKLADYTVVVINREP
ncbi:MAG: hypothetical protein NC343_04580 [Muribaculum sp.]|nr:hypothetical protein [Muribaculaceae bacterium]MCM1081007.1 hypothetical protein [Muribaculum sp.]